MSIEYQSQNNDNRGLNQSINIADNVIGRLRFVNLNAISANRFRKELKTKSKCQRWHQENQNINNCRRGVDDDWLLTVVFFAEEK